MFAIVGLVGLALLVVSFVFDDLIDGLVPDLGWVSGPVIGASMAAYGLVGWGVSGAGAIPGLAFAAAAAGGVGFGFLTYRIGRALWAMPTDATPTTSDTVGTEGRVVTDIGAGRLGEVLVTLGGQPAKLSATADVDVVSGTQVVIVAVESATKVRVVPRDDFWS